MRFSKIIRKFEVVVTLADFVITIEYTKEGKMALPFFYVKGFTDKTKAKDFFLSLKAEDEMLEHCASKLFNSVKLKRESSFF